MAPIKPLSATDKMIQMTEGAMERYFQEKAAKIAPYSNENEKIQQTKNSAINAVILAEVQSNGTPAIDDQPAVLEKCLALAAKVADAQLKRRWEDFRLMCVEMRESETHPAMVWAAKRCGVDISEKTLKELIRLADANTPVDDTPTEDGKPRIVAH